MIFSNYNQFKDINDEPYDKNHPEVYSLVIDLLKSKNKLNLQGDFVILLDYLDQEQRRKAVNILIKKKDTYYLCNLIYHNKLTYEQKNKAINILIENKDTQFLYNLIKANKLTQEQRQRVKAEFPNIKVSKKNIKISKILFEIAKML